MLNYLDENEVIDEDHSALWKWTTSETFVWIETLKNVRVDFFFICNKTEDFSVDFCNKTWLYQRRRWLKPTNTHRQQYKCWSTQLLAHTF